MKHPVGHWSYLPTNHQPPNPHTPDDKLPKQQQTKKKERMGGGASKSNNSSITTTTTPPTQDASSPTILPILEIKLKHIFGPKKGTKVLLKKFRAFKTLDHAVLLLCSLTLFSLSPSLPPLSPPPSLSHSKKRHGSYIKISCVKTT